MGKIQVLDIAVANLIAAGEVVDRPASVVKELLENAIDADSNIITVEIKRGGVTYIRVTDNGCGMRKDDLPIALKRHATSKIREASDLDAIMTLGFRGEALAAITSVSTVRILTKSKEEQTGAYLHSIQGEITELGNASCPQGTTITVEELFSNVPARRKFLKSDMAEAMAVSAVVEKIALSHPKISIRFISDNNLKFSTSGDGKLQNTIYAILGREFSKRLIPLEHTTDGIRISGYIGSPDQIKGNRNYENFFINGRYIKSRTAMAALEQAYHSYIPSDKFPCCVLNVYLHPAFVDVNVHPTKLEVKFSNERMVFDGIYSAVRSALLQKIERPNLKFGDTTAISTDDMKYVSAFTPLYEKMSNDASDEEVLQQMKLEDTAPQILTPLDNEKREVASSHELGFNSSIPQASNDTDELKSTIAQPTLTSFADPLSNQDFSQFFSTDALISDQSIEFQKTSDFHQNIAKRIRITPPSFQILGVAFHAYVFLETENKILVIDKHAAHERILFEQLKENISLDAPATQPLFMPIEISLDAHEYASACDYKEEIKKLGFAYHCEDKTRKISTYEIPISFNIEQSLAFLSELFSNLQQGTSNVALSGQINYEKALYQASCKAAVKAGRIDDIEHIRWICYELLSLPDIKFCPHGRPVAFELTKQDLEKQFKRT